MFKQTTRKALSLILILAMVLSIAPFSFAAEKTYTDVPANYWAYNAIYAWSQGDNAILEGDGQGRFLPGDVIDDTSVDVVLGKILGNAGEWKRGNSITREAALVKVAKAFGIDTVAKPSALFADDELISTAAKPYIYGLKARGYVVGYKNEFNPKGTFTRAEVIQIVYNIISQIADKNVSDVTVQQDFVIRKTGVTLKDATVKGDLIVAQGVKDGDVTLDNVTVTGKLIVYGGGSHSIVIRGASKINTAILNKTEGESVRIKVDGSAFVTNYVVKENSQAIISGGKSVTLEVEADAEIVLADGANLEKVEIIGNNVVMTIESGGVIETLKIDGKNGTITVAEGAAVPTPTGDGADTTKIDDATAPSAVSTASPSPPESPSPSPSTEPQYPPQGNTGNPENPGNTENPENPGNTNTPPATFTAEAFLAEASAKGVTMTSVVATAIVERINSYYANMGGPIGGGEAFTTLEAITYLPELHGILGVPKNILDLFPNATSISYNDGDWSGTITLPARIQNATLLNQGITDIILEPGWNSADRGVINLEGNPISLATLTQLVTNNRFEIVILKSDRALPSTLDFGGLAVTASRIDLTDTAVELLGTPPASFSQNLSIDFTGTPFAVLMNEYRATTTEMGRRLTSGEISQEAYDEQLIAYISKIQAFLDPMVAWLPANGSQLYYESSSTFIFATH
ncbi:hypothetical protein FACS1894202_01290 [Clostridia bacterium]|nr:hypothetical protein FACS1894202_01290 [Clostridia bacterium]